MLRYLAAALLLASPLAARAAADELGPARRAEIAAEAANWREHKAAALRMMARIPDEARREGWPDSEIRRLLRQVQGLLSQLEATQLKIRDLARAELALIPDSPRRRERLAALDAAIEGRLLTAYGNMFPRIVDEGFEDTPGDPRAGRRYAGPEWKIVLTWEESQAYQRWTMDLSGFDGLQWKDLDERARRALGLPPPAEEKGPRRSDPMGPP